jgi:predicted HTH transcriptional regulator
MFAQMGRAEELGSGLRNIYKYSKAYTGNDNIQFDEKNIFVQTGGLTFYRQKRSKKNGR